MITRTVVFPLDLTPDQEKSLSETVDLYTKSWNFCVDVAWREKIKSKKDLHNATYDVVRAKFELKSQYTCSSRDRALESVLSASKLIKKGKKVSKPCSKSVPLRLDKNTFSFKYNREAITVAMQKKRINISLVWHRQAKRYRDWKCISGEIGFDRWNHPVLRLFFIKEPVVYQKTGVIIGADRGTKRPIVLSTNKFYGEAAWKEHERRLFSLISRLQSKGTKSAKRHLKKVWRRLRLFRENCDRMIAKEIMKLLEPGDTIVLEDLTNIRDRCGTKGKVHKKHRKQMGRWSFKRLELLLKYYAQLEGIYIEKVKPNYTSQTCSQCGIVSKKNRKSRSLYSCSCGLNLNADLNAARNIADRWCEANGGASGPPVNRPIVEASA
jgi:IS605 OrfB family transposase